MAAKSNYAELRLKTDRQLIHLANSELELGICDARQALESAENWAFAKSHYRMAEIAYAQAARLIYFTTDVGEDELRGVESRLALLREVLERLSVLGRTATPNADGTPILARALRKARGCCPEGSPEEDWLQGERVLRSQAACAVH